MVSAITVFPAVDDKAQGNGELWSDGGREMAMTVSGSSGSTLCTCA